MVCAPIIVAHGRLMRMIAVLTVAVAILPFVAHAQALDTPWNQLSGWSQYASPTLADINGDGKLEVFIPTNAGIVYGFYENGQAISGWPVTVATGRFIASAPAVGDINGDGKVEVVITAGFAGQPGIVVAYSANGLKLWELTPAPNPQTTNNGPGGVFASPVLADLNGDGRLDVLVASYDENIYAINGATGTPLFPPGISGHNGALITLGDSTWGTPAVGDVDGDGLPEIVVTSASNYHVAPAYGWTGALAACTKNNSLTKPVPRACGMVTVYSNTGVLKPGWPKFVPGQTYDASPVLVDVNGDGKQEIVTGNGWDPTFGDVTQPFYVTIWNGDGSIRARYNIGTEVFFAPAIGDITGDSAPEIVVTTSDRVAGTPNQRSIFAFDLNMNLLPGFPVAMTGAISHAGANTGPVTLADLNGDGKAEILVGNSDFEMRALSGTGLWRDDVLLIRMGLPVASQAAVADVDGDGKLEVFAASGYQANFSKGAIFRRDLTALASATALPWAQFHGNANHTGLYQMPDLKLIDGVSFITVTGQQRIINLSVSDTLGGGMPWSAQVITGGAWIALAPSSGTTPSTLQMTLTTDAAGMSTPGNVATGSVRITSGTISKDIAVRLSLVDQIRSQVYFPLLSR